MARINSLIDRISDPILKQQLLDEVNRLKKQKKFGLVFEEHLPEATPLYDLPIVKGCLVSLRDKSFENYYLVEKVDGDDVYCEKQDESHDKKTFKKDEIVRVALFGQPIYPSLQSLDEVKNAPDNNLWHTLIEADNYHALQLLVYLYGGMVDCIYIDPPYNTGDKSWKYNNDFVDSNDSYRHSKWLSMMKKRLLLAKKLLNPQDSVLIVTIDEKEYLRLGCLLEELFPDANIQMVTSVISAKGVVRTGQFSRVEEYIFIIEYGCSHLSQFEHNMLDSEIKKVSNRSIEWLGFRRRAPQAVRGSRPNQFYPIFVNKQTGLIHSIGDVLTHGVDRKTVVVPENCIALWPLSKNGDERLWSLQQSQALINWKKGYIKVNWNFKKDTGTVYYLAEGTIADIEKGVAKTIGFNTDGSINAIYPTIGSTPPKRVWNVTTHNAELYGTNILTSLIGNRFEFPKSLYAVHDVIRFYVADKPNALIVDFFAGSGTTLHAVNLLNAEDGGNRRCIMVTNNEVSAGEEVKLKNDGYHPGQPEWDKWGIARYVNWPRTKCSILGVDINGNPLTGCYQTFLRQERKKDRYIKQISLIDNPSSLKVAQKKELVSLCCQGKMPQSLVKGDCKFIVSEDHVCSILFDINYSEEWLEALNGQNHVAEFYIVTRDDIAFKEVKEEIEDLLGKINEEEPVLRPMSDGFAANVKYFKLGFLDKHYVALHRQFREILPILWMKAGAIGECPMLSGNDIPDALVFAENKMAILTNEDVYFDFRSQMERRKDIKYIFIIAKSEHAFLEMAQPFAWAKTYHLYKDYLDNFSINYER